MKIKSIYKCVSGKSSKLNQSISIVQMFTFMVILINCSVSLAQPGFITSDNSGPLPLPPQMSTDINNDSLNVGYCVDHAGGNSCTANDFSITSIKTLNIDDGCTSPTDYMQIDMEVAFAKTQSTRYEPGAWFYRGPDANNPVDFNTQDAFSGDFCIRKGLELGLVILDGNEGTPQEEETRFVDGDGCVDAPGNTGSIEPQIINNMILPCRDVAPIGNLDGITDISACTTWNNNQNKFVCLDDNFRSFTLPHAAPSNNEIQPENGSKCNCGEFDGGPILVRIPDMSVSKVCEDATNIGANPIDQEVPPGGVIRCTITLTNNGLGSLIGATQTQETVGVSTTITTSNGFFYQDDYPESQGSITNIISPVQPMLPPADGITETPTVVDDFLSTDPSNQSLNIYPGTIAPNGGTFIVVYDFTTDAGLPVNSITSIQNTVCTASYNNNDQFDDMGNVIVDGVDEIFTYDDLTNCATDVVTTPVSISSFKASVSKLNSGYDFTWSTETETGNLGFNIYAIMGKTKFKLNEVLIPSSVIDSMNQQNYNYHINSQLNGLVSEFIIEDVDRLGRKHSNGVYKLGQQHGVVQDESMQKNTDWYTINQEFEKTIKLKNINLSGVLNKQMRITKDSQQKAAQQDINVLMKITETGIYKVSYQDLSQLGIDLSNLKSDSISVSLKDQLLPLDMHVDSKTNIFKPGSYFQFYAENRESLYTDENIYTLNLNANQASPEMPVKSSPPHGNKFAGSYEKTVKLNRNQAYSYASPVPFEPWYDTRMLAVRSPSTSYINLSAQNKATGDAKLSLVYWGGLNFDNDELDHSIEFKINGVELGTDRFDGLTLRNKSYTISDDLLRDTNEIELILSAQTVNKVDLINLESASLSYPSRFISNNDKLSFYHAEANFNVELQVNPDVEIFAIQGNDVVKLKNFKSKQQVDSTYNIQFSGIKDEAKYFIIAKDKIATPFLQMSQAKDASIAATEHLIISHGNFIGNELTAYAESTRDDYRIVDVADIYHLYSDNRPDGEAIKSYIADVANNGDLQSVMLVGGDTYDYKNYKGLDSISFVPTIYRTTDKIIKFSAVDALFGDIDNDNVPEVAVGRLPVRTLNELMTIIEKTQIYNSHNNELSAILAADASDSLSAYQFTAVSNQLANQLVDDNWSISTAYLDEKSIENSRQDVINAMNDGVRLAIYTGHSSHKTWSFKGLFKSTYIDSLTNIDDPFGVVQWGCWNTYFVDPKEDSLGHEFMLSGNRGAAFVLGASTLTNATQESFFSNIFNSHLISEGESIGSAMIKSKQEFAADRDLLHKDILWGITILGDPLIQVK
jgi:hypothetical protein